MKNSGSARIGSLVDYRNTEKYGELTSNNSEWIKKPAGSISNVNAENIRSYSELERLIHVEGSGEIGQINVKEYTVSSPNFLIFSTFRIYCKETHRLWKDHEGYDSCYRITSARLFFRAISEALGPNYEFLGWGEVHFTDRMDITSSLTTGFHPALIKHQTGYTAPSEIRAIWQPKNSENVEPKILDNSRAGLYCCEHRHRYLVSKNKLN
jgi:hypothetical protein